MIADNPLEIENSKLKEEIYDLKDKNVKFKKLKRKGEKCKKVAVDLIKKRVLNEHRKERIQF